MAKTPAKTKPRKGPPRAYAHPDGLPARVVYTIDGRLIPAIPNDPDQQSPQMVTLPTFEGWGKLSNGLTARADCMARFMARNMSGSEALRAVYRCPNASNKDVANRANRIVSNPTFRRALVGYREELARGQSQASIPMEHFVKGSLVKEAQSAMNDGARVRSLELLGKSVSMFTDVKRVETFTSGDVDKLKAQLNQRLSSLLERLGMTPSQGATLEASPANPTPTAPPETQRVPSGSSLHINPPMPLPVSSVPVGTPPGGDTPLSGDNSVEDPGGYYFSEFEGPLVTKTL